MAHPKSDEARQSFLDSDPFNGFKIDDNSILSRLEGRHPCPECGKSRKFFCYTCYVPIKELESKLPRIKLPLKIDIIKHKREIDGKSTSGHAKIIAPNDVEIYTYPDIPDYSTETAVLIFPSSNSITINQLFENSYTDILNMQPTNPQLPKGFHQTTLLTSLSTRTATNPQIYTKHLPVSKAIFIDSTWNQSKGIFKDERIRRIPTVVIQNRVSQFWRHQRGSPRWYLATIEAIHQFLVEMHLNVWGVHSEYEGLKNCFTEKYLGELERSGVVRDVAGAYRGEYDNLLYFFQHMYRLIHEYYDHEELYAYKRRLL